MAYAQTAPGHDDETLQRKFWRKARRVAAHVPFAEDLVAAYYCAFDHNTPLKVKGTLIGALAYFVLPLDAMPDIMPMLGFSDDAVVLATAIKLVASHIQPTHRDVARNVLSRL